MLGRSVRTFAAMVVVAAAAIAAPPARAAGTVGTTFPTGFPVIIDNSLRVPVIGFGSNTGHVQHTPVILLHGNNDTPYPTTCNGSYGAIQPFGQYLVDHGYNLSEVWALGYQGDQCDLPADETRRAATAHTTLANVPDLRAFVNAVLQYTHASQVDIVGHSLGATLAREWMRQDNAYAKVRRLVSIDGPHHGIINCSPNPQNYYHSLGFVPDSPVCLEYGSDHTPFLTTLNAGGETPGPTEYLAIVNTDTSFVYISKQDGTLPAVPAEDREGRPHDFSRSARLAGAQTVELTGQGIHDMTLLASHTGIVNSPDAWKATFDFLTRPAPAAASASLSAPATGGGSAPGPIVAARRTGLPATGEGTTRAWAALAALALALTGARATRRGPACSRPRPGHPAR